MPLTIYKASAGSGKTYTLVKEYIQMLYADDDDAAYRRILAVTFTHKATNEMKQRLIQQLYTLAEGKQSPYRKDLKEQFHLNEEEINAKAHRLLLAILQDYSSFSISTIDSFFQRIIRSFAREIGLSGSYNVGLDTDVLLQQAIDTMFSELEENSELFKWLIQYTKDNIQEGKSWNIRKDIEKLGYQLFTEQYLRHQAHQKGQVSKTQLRTFKTGLLQSKTILENQLKDIGTRGMNTLRNAGLDVTDFKSGERSAMTRLRDWEKGTINPPTKTFNTFCEGSEQCYAKSADKNIKQSIDNVYPQLQPILQEALNWWEEPYKKYETTLTLLQHLNTVGILGDIASQIRTLTKEQNILPISDTNILLHKIIGESDTPFIYEKIGTRYKHYMLDEFQDTSTMQWENFRPLIEESIGHGHKNLVVGDVKQSIYRWRNSDWTLLGSQIQQDIHEVKEETLPKNYRSGDNIIQFNNRFFQTAIRNIKEQLKQEYNDERLCHTLDKAYDTIHQQPGGEKPYKGFVEIVQQNESDKQNYQEWATELTLRYIQELCQAGVSLNDITLLVRRNKEAQHLTSVLLENGYHVMSNEGLCINNAVAVRFIINLLHLQLDPESTIRFVITNYYYLLSQGMEADEAIQKATQNTQQLLFSEEEEKQRNEINKLSLCDRVQQLIGLFHLGNLPGEEMFLQSFLDCIFQYVNDNSADLRGFMEWWEDTGKFKTIPSPTMNNAIHVMSIHQSKGLEFPYVIIPFAWDIKVMQGDILWCENPEKQDDTQPHVVPISSKENLINTKFAHTYLTEKLNILIDNLNLMYVAFTRAEKGLFCFNPFKKEGKINSTANLIGAYLNLHKQNTTNTEKDIVYQEGEKDFTSTLPAHQEEVPTLQLGFQYSKLKQRLRVKDTFIPHHLNQSLQDDKRRMGIIMHDILKNIRYAEDFQRATTLALYEGKITEKEVEFVEQALQRFLELVKQQNWFDKCYIVRNEASILLPNGTTRRPDRLLIDTKNKKAIVIDYKFGEKKEEKHITQVKEYKQHIQAMGYHCQTFLCYVEIGEIVEV